MNRRASLLLGFVLVLGACASSQPPPARTPAPSRAQGSAHDRQVLDQMRRDLDREQGDQDRDARRDVLIERIRR